MDDRKDEGEGPLSSAELEKDRDRAEGGTTLSERDAGGHTLPASESGPEPDEKRERPSPIAGTMLPPD